MRVWSAVRKSITIGVVVGLMLVWFGLTVDPALAQRRLQFLRDAETEHNIRTMAEPIFSAAGLDPEAVTIVLVNDPVLNAFVAGGQNIFLHTGLLLHSDDPLQLMGVIAHESGHIAGGHLIRLRDELEGASAQALLATIIGLGAAIASGQGGAAAIGASGAEIARRNLLSFSRAQESAADQAGLAYLERAGISSRGMLDFLEHLSARDAGLIDSRIEYLRTHPLTIERVSAVRFQVERSRHTNRPPAPEIVEMHRRIRAKLLAFLQPASALRRYPDSDTSIVGQYARAYAHYRRGDIARAIAITDQLIRAEPSNPFFHELKGQILFENGRIAESLTSYRRSVELLPDSSLLQIGYAHALLEGGRPADTDTAIGALDAALRLERRSPEAWRLLAVAWNRKGDEGRTAYATAESALSRGDRAGARQWSERALRLLPRGSPPWIRAQDIQIAVGNSDPDR